jgi:transposase
MKDYTRFVGLDVHKDSILPAVAVVGRGDPQVFGRIPNDHQPIVRWLNRRLRAWRRMDDVLFCYEAGPCGYQLYRLLTELNIDCQVIAPSLVPRRPSDRVKTDRRDACQLARLLRAGELTPIWVPDKAHEAFRTLLRTREAAVGDRTRSRHRLTKFLGRVGPNPPKGVNRWTRRFERWLDSLNLDQLADQFVLLELRHQIQENCDRVSRFDAYIKECVETSVWRPAIEALQCLRGVQLITAATIVAELGDIRRFPHPRRLMSYAGLVPGEYSSGKRTRRLSITKAGNTHFRRVVGEMAWHYRHRPHVSVRLARRQKGQPAEVIAISWRAQVRLNYRYRYLLGRGKDKNRVITALARELQGFIWEILQVVPPPTAKLLAA